MNNYRYVKLTAIKIAGGRVDYEYQVCDELKKYFHLDAPFFLEYDFDVAGVPQGILAVPFVVTILPFIWMYDAVLELPELDRDFYDSIPEFKKGYVEMFPEIDFKGKLQIGVLTVNRPVCSEQGTSAGAFFSGGVDAYATLAAHLGEQPRLLTIHGADVAVENNAAFQAVWEKVCTVTAEYGLECSKIVSSFRNVLYTAPLHEDFSEKLKDDWWHGLQHGIGVIGHAAPVAYKYGMTTLYIASSFTPEDGQIRCASYPTIDNYVRFAGCRVVHDGFEYSRQNKVRNIVEFVQKTNHKISLRVCWHSDKGVNCGQCEKCYRTMLELLAEGADPNEYGFVFDRQVCKRIRHFMQCECVYSPVVVKYWTQIQKRMADHRKKLKKSPYYKDVKWVYGFDFTEGRKMTWKERLAVKRGKAVG